MDGREKPECHYVSLKWPNLDRPATKDSPAQPCIRSKEISRSGFETLKQEGVLVSQPDEAAFRDAVKDLYKKYEGKMWPEGLVAKIKALQE